MNGIERTIDSIPALSDVADGDSITRDLRMFQTEHRDIKGVGMQAAFMDSETIGEICDLAEQRVDMRRARKGQSITVGEVAICGDGTIASVEIRDEYQTEGSA